MVGKKTTWLTDENRHEPIAISFFIKDANGQEKQFLKTVNIAEFKVNMPTYNNRIVTGDNSSAWATLPDSVQFVLSGAEGYTNYEFAWDYGSNSRWKKFFAFFNSLDEAILGTNSLDDRTAVNPNRWFSIRNNQKIYYKAEDEGDFVIDVTIRAKDNHSVRAKYVLKVNAKELYYNKEISSLGYTKRDNSCSGDMVGKPYDIIALVKQFKGSVNPNQSFSNQELLSSHADYNHQDNPNHKVRVWIGNVQNAIENGISIDGFNYIQSNHCE